LNNGKDFDYREVLNYYFQNEKKAPERNNVTSNTRAANYKISISTKSSKSKSNQPQLKLNSFDSNYRDKLARDRTKPQTRDFLSSPTFNSSNEMY
jgi:hypothetical protein